MATLVLRNVPELLMQRLKAITAAHRRSMTQEAILALQAGLGAEPPQPRPGVEEMVAWLEANVWNLPVVDQRSSDEILGYGDDGLCH